MSGSAGLAAAKRRRAGPSVVTNELPKRPSNIPVQKQQVSQQPSIQSNISNTHPLVLIAQHEQHLARLQMDVEELRMNNERSNFTSIPNVDEQSIQFFKSKYDSLSQEMEEMKKLLIKIQTFSMETNLELLKMKRLLKKENDTDESGLDRLSINE
jgi:hypothetical protein